MRNKLIALACVLCFSFMLTACSNSENNENAQGTGTPSATVTEQPNNRPTETPTPTPHEHSYTSTTTKEATCSEVGETTYTCSCGDTYKEDIAKVNHTESDWIVVTEVTATTDGLQHKICTVCNEELASEVISCETFVVASGKLSDATIEWKIVGTTLYISGVGEIPDFSTTMALARENPHVLEDVRDWQFYDELVEKIVIEDGITKIGKSNFDSFKKVTEIIIPDSVTEVGKWGCNGLGISSIDFNNITKLGSQAFGNLVNLKSVTIPGSIKVIPEYMFFYCKNLTEIHIEEGVEEIGHLAFNVVGSNCHIYLPASLKALDEISSEYDAIYHVKKGSNAEELLKGHQSYETLTIIVE